MAAGLQWILFQRSRESAISSLYETDTTVIRKPTRTHSGHLRTFSIVVSSGALRATDFNLRWRVGVQKRHFVYHEYVLFLVRRLQNDYRYIDYY